MEFDPSQIGTAIELTTKGTKALQGVFDLYKSFQKQKEEAGGKLDDPKVEQFIIDLMEQVTEAKLANIDMKEQLIELKEQLLDFRVSTEQFANYEMYETATGRIVWKLKDNPETGEPAHFICPTCKESGVKSILQGAQDHKICHRCQTGFSLEPSRSLPRRPNRGFI